MKILVSVSPVRAMLAVAASPVAQEKIDRAFMSFLRSQGIAATAKGLSSGRVKFYMSSPKKLTIVSDSWDTFTLTDKIAASNGMVDLAGVSAFFKRHGVGISKKPTSTKITNRQIYD